MKMFYFVVLFILVCAYVMFISVHTSSPLDTVCVVASFLTVPMFLTMQSKLAPCPANANRSSDYSECILSLSSVTEKRKTHKESTQKEYRTYTPGPKLWVIVTKNLIHTAPCEPLCLESAKNNAWFSSCSLDPTDIDSMLLVIHGLWFNVP